jgi:uncharacterized protein YndB with AHSA1/START domain
MQKEIKHSWFFSHPPETIWEYLTNSELLSQWLMKNDFKPVVGQKFMFRAGSHPEMEFDGNIYCEVLEILPLKRISYSWQYGPRKGEIVIDSIVTWTLTSKNAGTELILEHTGFRGTENPVHFKTMNAGWQTNVNKIEGLISTKIKNEKASS